MNEYLQVEGHEDIFALGDCTNVKEKKLVAHAQGQADTFLNNLKLKLKGDKPKPYKPGMENGNQSIL